MTAERIDGDGIADAIRSDILAGRLAPGTRLREVGLAERFQVSRTPVREALTRLEQERLARRQGRGLYVHAPDTDEIVQIYDLRILLEEEAAGQAARSRGGSDLVELRALLHRDESLEDPADELRLRTNLEFHAAVWRATQNPVLQDLLARLGAHLVHAPHSTLSVADRWPRSLEEHRALVEAIEAQDAPAARAIARAHFEEARRIRLDLLRTWGA